METNSKKWQRIRQIYKQIGNNVYTFELPVSYIKLFDKAGSCEREANILLSDKNIYSQFNGVDEKDSYEYFMNCGMELEEVESLYNWKRSDLKYLIWLILSDELERMAEEEEERGIYAMLSSSG